MGQVRNQLTATQVKALGAGRHADGGGLYCYVAPSGARSWVYRWKRDGKRREMGLGAFPTISLAKARALADQHRATVAGGGDPLAQKRRGEVPTFDEAALQFIAANEASWRNAKHRAQWRSTLSTYASPVIGRKMVSDINNDDVLRILSPIWLTKPETAQRVRGRIERILDFTVVKGWRPHGLNPAAWKGNLALALPRPKRLSRGHHAALPFAELPAFMAALRSRRGMAARALEFTILTAARSGEVRGAEWSEIDLDERLWTVPAERMKAGRVHRIPLSASLVDLLVALPRVDDSGLVFPGARGRAMSDMTLAAVLRRMGRDDLTVHGFRSTFRDWAGDMTSFPREVAEAALAHAVGDATERAYRRADALGKRQKLMDEWGRYCFEGSVNA